MEARIHGGEAVNILIVGLGVIGSTYGYLFQKAGHQTEHFFRENSSKAHIAELKVELLDGRINSSGEWKRDTYSVHYAQPGKAYDFIFVSVPAGGIAAVLCALNAQNIQGTLILACGIWDDRKKIEELMRGRDYVLGYPVAGGNIRDGVLSCCVFDHFMLEREEKAGIQSYRRLTELLHDCRIKPEIPYDMLEWIWLHMAINAGVITVAGKYGDIHDTAASAEKLMNSSKELSEAVLSIRETAKIIASRGVCLKNYRGELLPYRIPSKIAGVVMKKMFAGNLLTRKIMTLHSNPDDLLYVCKNVYDCGKQNTLSTPIFYKNCEALGLAGEEAPVAKAAR